MGPGGEEIVAAAADHGAAIVQRHGAPGQPYVLPHRIDHAANLRALAEQGCDRVLGIGSVGSLKREIPVGTVLCPDDFIALHLGVACFVIHPLINLIEKKDHSHHENPPDPDLAYRFMEMLYVPVLVTLSVWAVSQSNYISAPGWAGLAISVGLGMEYWGLPLHTSSFTEKIKHTGLPDTHYCSITFICITVLSIYGDIMYMHPHRKIHILPGSANPFILSCHALSCTLL